MVGLDDIDPFRRQSRNEMADKRYADPPNTTPTAWSIVMERWSTSNIPGMIYFYQPALK